ARYRRRALPAGEDPARAGGGGRGRGEPGSRRPPGPGGRQHPLSVGTRLSEAGSGGAGGERARSLPPDQGQAPLADSYGSRTVRIWSAFTPLRTCVFPDGQVTVNCVTTVSVPRPKCTRRSEA